MGTDTIIAWTDHTFNVAWGCTKVSPGCAHCYAETFASRKGLNLWGKSPRRILSDNHWKQPHTWNRVANREGESHRVFCGSMCDVMEDHKTIAEQRNRLWRIIQQTPMLDWQILTKRPENYQRFLPPDWAEGYENVWLGTSIENNDYVHRADLLRSIPAKVHFISYEPALGPLPDLNLDHIEWLIYGGESGSGYRPHNPQWARDIKDKCDQAGTTFFFKQSSAIRTEMGITLDGQSYRDYPLPRRLKPIPLLA